MTKKIFLPMLLLFAVAAWGCGSTASSADSSKESMDYRKAMASLVADIHHYGEERHAGFGIIANGCAGLFLPEDGPSDAADIMLASVDGVMSESVYYGQNADGMADDAETPAETTAVYERAFAELRRCGKIPLNIDYCSSPGLSGESYRKNDTAGCIGFAAPHRNLDIVPGAAPHNENAGNCRSLGDIKNVLPLLNPGNFSSKEEYLGALRGTNYDLLIIDLFVGGEALSPEDVRSLQQKANGGRRLVYAYMSIGEAADYLWYWQPSWSKNPPDWIADANEDWEGDYKVKYWRPEWHDILMGRPDCYLDRILAAGFDGAFLDVVDAYWYFEDLAAGEK